jgi:hypothetical protein
MAGALISHQFPGTAVASEDYRTHWTSAERRLMRRLRTPMDVQRFLNDLPYNPSATCYGPRGVLKEQKAHCFEGALFAAAALRWQGRPPLIVDIVAHNDDDHVIALFKSHHRWGAIAKSNTTVLRFREPVYRTLRELVMSYFDMYFNIRGEKTMRSYSRPIKLSRFDVRGWMTDDNECEYISDHLFAVKHQPVLSSAMIRSLERTDPALMDAGFLGSDAAGLFQPV